MFVPKHRVCDGLDICFVMVMIRLVPVVQTLPTLKFARPVNGGYAFNFYFGFTRLFMLSDCGPELLF